MIKDLKKTVIIRIIRMATTERTRYIDCIPVNLFMINSECYLMDVKYLYRI